ncbi:MAG: inner-membrane translocator [Gammaproteobacteria bacterium]|nr:inner-membrane translocator [Gammaproteobacteria bacterium]
MATRRHSRPQTALAADYAFTAVDDYDVRTYMLPQLRDPESRARIIAEHRANPRGAGSQPGAKPPNHSDILKRLIDKLRMTPQAGKHTIVETKPWEEYAIGILPGRRGGVVKITRERYPTREDAEHAIFLKRLNALLDHYGVEH